MAPHGGNELVVDTRIDARDLDPDALTSESLCQRLRSDFVGVRDGNEFDPLA
jgi:hypothetical protein